MTEGTNIPTPGKPGGWKAKVLGGIRSAGSSTLNTAINSPLERIAGILEKKVNDRILSAIHEDFPSLLDEDTVAAIKQLDPRQVNGLLRKTWEDFYEFELYFSVGSTPHYLNTTHLDKVIAIANQGRTQVRESISL